MDSVCVGCEERREARVAGAVDVSLMKRNLSAEKEKTAA